MSKFTLADRLRDIAAKIELLPESDDISIEVRSHTQVDVDALWRALLLADGCESRIQSYGSTNWVEFREIHGEPITVTVYYKPDLKGLNQ